MGHCEGSETDRQVGRLASGMEKPRQSGIGVRW